MEASPRKLFLFLVQIVHAYNRCLFFIRDDIDTALKIFQDAKEDGEFLSDATCLLMLNSMARTGRLEHFENGKKTRMFHEFSSSL